MKAVKRKFFANYRVSVMFDPNGSNTTAAAAVAWLVHAAPGQSLKGKRAVVLAGTGPVGQRAALMLAREGARVAYTYLDTQFANEEAVKAADAVKTGTIAARNAAVDAGLPALETIPIPVPRPKA